VYTARSTPPHRVLASLFVLLTACGSGSADHGGPSPPSQLLSGDIIGARCENLLECLIPSDEALFVSALFRQRPGEAMDNCRSYFAAPEGSTWLAHIQHAQARGGLRVDDARLEQLSSCQLPIRDRSWLVAQVPLGEPCQLHAECVDGFCDTAASCPGACVARRPDGAHCLESFECLSNACEGTCVQPSLASGAGEGAVCADEGSALTLCAPGLWCEESSGRCRKPIAAGADCSDSDDVCLAGHFCVPIGSGSDSEPQRRCLPLAVQPLGAACDWERVTGDSVRICDDLNLDTCVDGTCVHHPDGRAGDPCYASEVADTCASGYRCEDRICVARLEDGARCTIDECLGRCDYETLLCVSAEPYCDESP